MLLLGLAGAMFFVVTRGPNAIARSRKVQVGMHIDQVRAIMGLEVFEGPEFSGEAVSGRFLLAGHNEGFINKLGQLAQKLGTDGLLTDSSTTVLITFDLNGKVVEITRGEDAPIRADRRIPE